MPAQSREAPAFRNFMLHARSLIRKAREPSVVRRHASLRNPALSTTMCYITRNIPNFIFELSYTCPIIASHQPIQIGYSE
jgi:hypothetical protein